MKMKLRENILLKAAAVVLAAASLATGAVMGWYQIVNGEVLWGSADVGEGHAIRAMEYRDLSSIQYYLDLLNEEALDRNLGTYFQQRKTELEERFDPENTNLRWYAVSEDGGIRYGNTEEEPPERATGFLWGDYVWENRRFSAIIYEDTSWAQAASGAVNLPENYKIMRSEAWRADLIDAVNAYISAGGSVDVAEDTADDAAERVYMDTAYITDVLEIQYNGEKYVYGPTVRAFLQANEFGYIWNDGWSQVEYEDQTGGQRLNVYLWLETGLPVDDGYAQAVLTLRGWQANRELALAAAVALLAVGVVLTVLLCVACGHKQGYEGVWLNWFHRIPGDLMLAAVGSLGLLGGLLLSEWDHWIDNNASYYSESFQTIWLGVILFGMALLLVGSAVTFVARCKGHTLLRGTVVWRVCVWAGRGCRAVLAAIPLIWKVLAAGVIFGAVMLVVHESGFLLFLLWVAAMGFLCLWAYQWGHVRGGAKKILSGQPDEKIGTRGLLPELKEHAEELNNLGGAISGAVEERMRSERFKAELITNVSHDLKTPLTSIINYVDLLKKELIDNENARAYIEVLDRKSQRLKKLTEDLVEASKASTGNLTVTRERIGLIQLAEQAVGEYEGRLAESGLKAVQVFPEEEVWVMADGRHLWRVLDNLFSNCAKYALSGTRVYVEVRAFSDCAELSVKNISRDALNIPPEALVERFTRGEESRTTEGSGLGLSIAQSLTELQDGHFALHIDGDLFKAAVTLPLAQ